MTASLTWRCRCSTWRGATPSRGAACSAPSALLTRWPSDPWTRACRLVRRVRRRAARRAGGRRARRASRLVGGGAAAALIADGAWSGASAAAVPGALEARAARRRARRHDCSAARPLDAAQRTLLVHGDADDTIPLADSEAIACGGRHQSGGDRGRQPRPRRDRRRWRVLPADIACTRRKVRRRPRTTAPTQPADLLEIPREGRHTPAQVTRGRRERRRSIVVRSSPRSSRSLAHARAEDAVHAGGHVQHPQDVRLPDASSTSSTAYAGWAAAWALAQTASAWRASPMHIMLSSTSAHLQDPAEADQGGLAHLARVPPPLDQLRLPLDRVHARHDGREGARPRGPADVRAQRADRAGGRGGRLGRLGLGRHGQPLELDPRPRRAGVVQILLLVGAVHRDDQLPDRPAPLLAAVCVRLRHPVHRLPDDAAPQEPRAALPAGRHVRRHPRLRAGRRAVRRRTSACRFMVLSVTNLAALGRMGFGINKYVLWVGMAGIVHVARPHFGDDSPYLLRWPSRSRRPPPWSTPCATSSARAAAAKEPAKKAD